MPTYTVTDPKTGTSLKLTGDSPPTEQELEEIFAAQKPASSVLGTAVDVVKGFGKGAVNTITSGTVFAPLINKMATKTFGKRAALPENTAGGPDEFLKQFEATNTPQMVGKGLEFATELAGPGVFPRVAKFVKGKMAASAAAKATALEAAKKAAPRLVKKGAPVTVEGAVGDVLEQARKAPLPEKISLPTTGDITTAGKPAITAKGYDELLEGAGKAKTHLTDGPHISPQVAEVTARTVPEVAKHADELANAGKVEEAVTTITTKATQTIAQMAQDLRRAVGSRRAGEMLNPSNPKEGAAAVKRLAPGPSRKPLLAEVAELDAGFKRGIMNERGAANPAVLKPIAGATGGAAIGATQGETTEDKIKYAALGGAAGAVAVPMIAHAVASGAPKAIQNYIYTSLLSSPTSIAKAYLGGVGGAIMAAEEKMASGQVREGTQILTRLFSPQHVSDMVRGFKNPQSLKTAGSLTQGVHATGAGTETLLGRAFDAANAPAVKAMRAGGLSTDEAWRYTLSGAPTTALGKDLIDLWNRHFALKLSTSLFPRVGIQVIERGLERTPVGLIGKAGLNKGVSKTGRVVRAAQGTGTALAAYEGADQVPDWGKPYLIALSNVYALPVAMGLGAGTARARGKSGADQVTAALDQFSQNAPFPRYGTTEALKQLATGATLVPNAVRDVAVAMDPYERKTDMRSTGFFGRAKAKIPGLRETLPVKGRQVNIAGKPAEDRSTPLKRLLSPAPKEANKLAGVPEKVASEIKRLGVNINAPALNPYREDKVLGRVTIPPDLLERAREERRQYLLPQLTKLVNGPAYDRADDAKRKRMISTVVKRSEEAGNQRARANVIRVMRSQGAFKK